jgi:hypothetical protein
MMTEEFPLEKILEIKEKLNSVCIQYDPKIAFPAVTEIFINLLLLTESRGKHMETKLDYLLGEIRKDVIDLLNEQKPSSTIN